MFKGNKGLSRIAVFLIIISAVTAISVASFALKTYDPATKTLTILNPLPAAEIQLVENTDQCLADCYAIIRLKANNQLTIPSPQNDDFKWEFLKDDSKKGLESYTFELRTEVQKQRPVFSSICNPYNETANSTTLAKNNCTVVENGTVNYTDYEYVPFDFYGYTFQAGKGYYIKLRGKKHVQFANSVEWIPTLFGVRVPEWATWTDGLIVGLLDYWKLNETGTTTVRVDSLGKFNITVTGTISEQAYGASQQFNNSWRGNTANDFGTMGRILNVSGNMTFSFWFNSSGSGYPMGNRLFGDSADYATFNIEGNNCGQSTSGLCFRFKNSGNIDAPDVSRDRWQHIVITASSSDRVYIWYNATLQTNNSAGAFSNITNIIILGSDGLASAITDLRWIDEVVLWNRVLTNAEISQLFNTSMTYQPAEIIPGAPPTQTVTLISPLNNSNFSSSTVTLNATITPSNGNISNATFYVWWSNGTLRSTHLNNTITFVNDSLNVTFTITNFANHSNYQWNVLSTVSNATNFTLYNISSASSNFTFTVDTIVPTMNITYPKNIVIPYYRSGTNITINWTANDTSVGVQTCLLEYNERIEPFLVVQIQLNIILLK